MSKRDSTLHKLVILDLTTNVLTYIGVGAVLLGFGVYGGQEINLGVIKFNLPTVPFYPSLVFDSPASHFIVPDFALVDRARGTVSSNDMTGVLQSGPHIRLERSQYQIVWRGIVMPGSGTSMYAPNVSGGVFTDTHLEKSVYDNLRPTNNQEKELLRIDFTLFNDVNDYENTFSVLSNEISVILTRIYLKKIPGFLGIF